jgi:hypothetical protein
MGMFVCACVCCGGAAVLLAFGTIIITIVYLIGPSYSEHLQHRWTRFLLGSFSLVANHGSLSIDLPSFVRGFFLRIYFVRGQMGTVWMFVVVV